jgi:hypothetical protein
MFVIPNYTRIIKLQAPNNKLQKISKSQAPMTQTFEILNFGHWDLFGI